MAIANAIREIHNALTTVPAVAIPTPNYDSISMGGTHTKAGKRVTPEVSKTLSSAYRCGNIISDDIASMPFQLFYRMGGTIQRIEPDPLLRNMPYLIEISPNRWMNPFIFKKTSVLWMIYWGNAYIWCPLGSRELFVLPASNVFPEFDAWGNLWYRFYSPSGKERLIPDVEILHLMINSTDGINGKSVITYAKETIGRQLGAHETQDRISGKGLNPAGALYVKGSLKGPDETAGEARKKIKSEFLDAISGSENSGGVAIFDEKIEKFESITMKPVDAQFLETMNFTDLEIANFFGLPLWKLNQGKQSYESNTQQQIDYLQTTLNPYLTQWEQAARLKWLRTDEQNSQYFRWIRESLLQMDPKSQAEYMKLMLESGQMTPNESRQIKDMSSYEGGDGHYFAANMASIGPDGKLISATGVRDLPNGGK